MCSESGHCYVWELKSKKLHHFIYTGDGIPHRALQSDRLMLLVSKGTVAIHEKITRENPDEAKFTIWKLDDAVPLHCSVVLPQRAFTQWRFTQWPDLDDIKIVHSADGETLLHCNKTQYGEDVNFRFAVWSRAGEFRDRRSLFIKGLGKRSAEVHTPISRDGPNVIWTFISPEHVIPNGEVWTSNWSVDLHITSIIYNTKTHEVSTKNATIPTHDAVCPGELVDKLPGEVAPKLNIFFLNDVAYYQICRYVGRQVHFVLKVINFQDLTCRNAEMDRVKNLDSSGFANGGIKWARRQSMPWDSSNFKGDERYLINYSYDEFGVWCFDKDITMAGQDLEYKVRMSEARQARLEQGGETQQVG